MYLFFYKTPKVQKEPISMADGSVFEIKCRRILEREDE